VVLLDFANKQTTNTLKNTNPDISKVSDLRKDNFCSAKNVKKIAFTIF
jgi:hypothetical protein